MPLTDDIRKQVLDAVEVLTQVLSEPDDTAAITVLRATVLDLRALWLRAEDLACPACKGTRAKGYPGTGVWHSRPDTIAGRAITYATCDVCWGTGRNDRKGLDLRQLKEWLAGRDRAALYGE
jgi:hypothetical protein